MPETAEIGDQAERDDFEDLLLRTSRTFALSIPLLPEPTRREVTLAYLLFRIADTFEDAPGWPPADKIAALERFRGLLHGAGGDEIAAAARRWDEEVPCAQSGYRELLGKVPAVLAAFFGLAPEAVALIREHTGRTIRGMAGYVARGSDGGELALADLDDLRAYCYTVAGIVGELLTELFLLGRPALAPAATALRGRARQFGEALQLVNILKDSAADAAEGRRYLPEGLARADVLALARQDLESAGRYVLTLQEAGAERGLVAFTALPVHLAHATLARVEEAGPGGKLTRPEVYSILQRLHRTLDRNEPVVWRALEPAGAAPLPMF